MYSAAACIVLHNICVDQNDPWDDDGDDYDRGNDDRNDDVMDDGDEIRDLLKDLVCGNIWLYWLTKWESHELECRFNILLYFLKFMCYFKQQPQCMITSFCP